VLVDERLVSEGHEHGIEVGIERGKPEPLRGDLAIVGPGIVYYGQRKALDVWKDPLGVMSEHDDQLIDARIRQCDQLAQHEGYSRELQQSLRPAAHAPAGTGRQQHRADRHAAVEATVALEETAHISDRSTPEP